jgi:hypothetical protein
VVTWQIFPSAEFRRLESQWSSLNDRSAATPLLDIAFVSPLIDAFAGDSQKLAVLGDLSRPAAMAVLSRKRAGVWESFQSSQAPLGLWLAEPAVRWETALPALQRALPLCALLAVRQLDPDHFARPASNGRLSTLDYVQTARITIDRSFEEYWKARGKNLRHNMKRQRSRLESAAIATRLEVVTEPERIEEAVLDYAKLENAGWKAEGGTAIAPGNCQHRFYETMLKRFATRAASRIYRYFFNDRLVATDLCLLEREALIILKTTYAESEKTSSPALLMREEAFAQLFAENRARRIEFYGKVMDWHTKWSDEIRMLYHINCYRFAWLKRMHRR